MKKVISLIIVICIVFSSVAVLVEEETEVKKYDDFVYITEGDRNVIIGTDAFGETLISNTKDNSKSQSDYFTYDEADDNVTITGLGDNAPMDIVIPGEINGKKVILETDAFEYEKIESVIIEEGITEIPQKCFYNCKNLKSVILPDSVTVLGYLAFANSGIEEIALPEFVENSGYSTFFECSSLKRVDLNNAKSVGLFSFRYCDSLETVTHSGNLTGIADFAFAGCSGLRNIDLSTVESFGKNVFQGCGSLSFVNLQSLKEWEGFYSEDVDDESMMLKSQGFYSHHTYSDPAEYKALLLGTSIDTVRIRFPETEDEELGVIFINSTVKNIVFDNFPENINRWEFYSAKSIDTSMNRKVKLEKKHKGFTIYGKDDGVREYAEMVGAEYRELIDITVDGKTLYSDVLPYIKNDRTLVPMRAIFEALGAEVSWDDATKTAIGKKGGVEVKITIGENVLYKSGEAIELDAAAEITNDRTMVPVRAISEAFGSTVEWDNDTKTAVITN